MTARESVGRGVLRAWRRRRAALDAAMGRLLRCGECREVAAEVVGSAGMGRVRASRDDRAGAVLRASVRKMTEALDRSSPIEVKFIDDAEASGAARR